MTFWGVSGLGFFLGGLVLFWFLLWVWLLEGSGWMMVVVANVRVKWGKREGK
jgi:hypothetical protein